MANIWMTRDEMIADSAILPAAFTAKYLDSNGEYIDCTYNKNDVLQNRVGVSDTTCDMSFWQNGDNGTNNRFIAQYLAANITNLPESASTRRITVEIPVYMRNVKYLDICFCVWIDLGYARMTSLSGFNDVSFYFYNKNGEKLKGYCIPTQGNDHPGTGRLSIQGSPGFVPFRFLYDDEENPADIDFISLEFSGAYSEQNQLNIWISQPCYNDDIEFTEEPQPEQQGGNWGDNTGKAGGDGTFYAPSDNFDDRNGAQLALIISAANTALKHALGVDFRAYYVREFSLTSLGDLNAIINVLYGDDYFSRFRNSMYNPLSAVVSCAMFPARFIHLIDGLYDMTAGGFNITENMRLQHIQFQTAEPLIFEHIGSIDITKYFGAFPDFAPYTTAKLYLPYCGEIDIDINKIMYGVLSVSYAVDILSGNCTAYVWTDDKEGNHNYIASISGNCAYNLPLFAATSDGAAMGKMVSGITSAMMGNLAGAGSALISGALSMPSRQTQISGTFSGNVGMTGRTKVLLQISRPQWVNPAQYQKQNGMPSQISGKISDFRGGFFQVETVDLETIPATDTEIAELEQMLKDGIYYNFE